VAGAARRRPNAELSGRRGIRLTLMLMMLHRLQLLRQHGTQVRRWLRLRLKQHRLPAIVD
jgi:hypothetical protein